MLTDAIKLTQIVIGRYHFTGFCGHQLWYPLAHPTHIPTPLLPIYPPIPHIWLHRYTFYEPTYWCCYAKVPFNAEFSWKFDFSSSIFVPSQKKEKKKEKWNDLNTKKSHFLNHIVTRLLPSRWASLPLPSPVPVIPVLRLCVAMLFVIIIDCFLVIKSWMNEK